jgi:2-succinyl-5-enolpyruvyl-6-hydroxy-3-cyclohexene-1-carboxylate synthase
VEQISDRTINIFGNYVRWSFTLPCPDSSISPAVVLTTSGQAVYRACRAPADRCISIACSVNRRPYELEGDIPEDTSPLLSVGWERKAVYALESSESRLTTEQKNSCWIK